MHHKFLVVDGQSVIVSTANFTTSDVHGDFSNPETRGNANSLVRLQSPELAALFTEEFNILWGDGPGGRPDSRFGVKKPFRPVQQLQLGDAIVELQFSPASLTIPWEQTSNGLISRTLSRAQKSVEMALFVFSEQPLVDTLETVNQRGVQIRALIDPSFAYRNYSEALDMMGIALVSTTAKTSCQVEPGNRPWKQPIQSVGIPKLPKGDLLHHKYGLVDQQTVIVGSHNWSAAANRGNDETLLVIQHPTVAAHYRREFERLYANSVLGVTPSLKRKLQEQEQKCGVITATAPAAATSEAPAAATAKSESPAASAASGPVNLNTASQAELESLPGVGPALAKRIIAARQQKPFASLADLDQVKGVGPKLLEQLQDQVTW